MNINELLKYADDRGIVIPSDILLGLSDKKARAILEALKVDVEIPIFSMKRPGLVPKPQREGLILTSDKGWQKPRDVTFIQNIGGLSTNRHSNLKGLDYASSGHTGFQAAMTFPLVPSLGGTGIANADANTLTLGGATTISTGGTIALGGYTLTVPATGTAAMVGYANVFTAQNSFGAGSNKVVISNSGNVSFEGTATYWDDMRVEPTVRAAAGAGVPTFTKWYDDAPASSKGVFLYNFTDEAVLGNEKEVFFTMQMPHGWAGTPIHLHVHWVGDATTDTATPQWGLEYAWKDIDEVFGDTVLVYATGNSSSDPGVTANKHYLTEFTELTPGATADGLSSILIGRLFRNSSAAADTYNAHTCGLLYVDAHIEYNQFGSNEELVK